MGKMMKFSSLAGFILLSGISTSLANAATVAFTTSFASSAPAVVSYGAVATGAATSDAGLTFGLVQLKAPFAAGSTPFTLSVSQTSPVVGDGSFNGRLSGVISLIGGFATVRFHEDKLVLGGNPVTDTDDVTYKLDNGGVFRGAVFGWTPTLSIPITGSVAFSDATVAAVPLPPAFIASGLLLGCVAVRRLLVAR
jgi:hypothetical protein